MLCIHNPKLPSADEAGWLPPKTSQAKKVLIVGAGPAGLEAAWTAAAAGHKVTLLDKDSEAGGALRLDAMLPGRADVAKVYRYQLAQAQRYGVELVLGKQVLAEDIIAQQPDVVLLASGGRLRPPKTLQTVEPIFSWREKVVELTEDESRRSGTAVLFDMDHTDPTYAFAELLAQRYEKLVVMTPRVQLARAVPYTNAIGIYRRLYQADADIITTAQPLTFSGGVVTYANVFNGKQHRIEGVALFTYSTPRQADDALFDELKQHGLDVRLIGDARSPRTIFSAVHEGFHQAVNL
jgi:threonine dehydrogenase-like Zn-dependent dehydrogenase